MKNHSELLSELLPIFFCLALEGELINFLLQSESGFPGKIVKDIGMIVELPKMCFVFVSQMEFFAFHTVRPSMVLPAASNFCLRATRSLAS